MYIEWLIVLFIVYLNIMYFGCIKIGSLFQQTKQKYPNKMQSIRLWKNKILRKWNKKKPLSLNEWHIHLKQLLWPCTGWLLIPTRYSCFVFLPWWVTKNVLAIWQKSAYKVVENKLDKGQVQTPRIVLSQCTMGFFSWSLHFEASVHVRRIFHH